MTTITHPKNTKIKLFYTPENHSYMDNNNEEYTSVTNLISKYFPQFDTETMALKCSKKRGVSKESLIKEWKKIGDEAADKGDGVHNYCNFLITNQIEKLKDIKIDNTYINQINNIYNSIKNKLDLVYSEKIIFSPELKLAGTCDAIFITKEKDKYVVIDWKTTKQMDFENKWNSYGFKPLNHLHNCNYIHYSLQLLC